MHNFLEKYLHRIMLTLICCVFFAPAHSANLPRILVFSKTSGWDHNTRTVADSVITSLGSLNGFLVTCAQTTGNFFTPESLPSFSAVCFINTTGTLFTPPEREALLHYVENGGGFIGIHAATDAEYDWKWYGLTLGATFNGHPCNVAPARIAVTNKTHLSTRTLTMDTLNLTDEWYFWGSNPDFRNNPLVNPANNTSVHVLLELVEASLGCITTPQPHPICWTRQEKLGRIWYCGLGHDPETFKSSLFQTLLLGGIQYAANLQNSGVQSTKNTRRQSGSLLTGNPEIHLFDLHGRKQKNINGTIPMNSQFLNDRLTGAGRTLSPGLYFMSNSSDPLEHSRKVVVDK
jgi:type 1 glutamine amidotransferase